VTLPPSSLPPESDPVVEPVEPQQPVAAAPPPPPPPPSPVVFPLSWMLEHASPALQFRSIRDVARVNVPASGVLPLAHRPALELAAAQQLDGTWSGSMLTLPSKAGKLDGVGTIHAVRRLLEYGWDKDTPPLLHARRVLFRLLAEDEDPSYLFELASDHAADAGLARRGRAILREAAAATLAQAGYDGDPRLRGAAKRILARISTWLRSPGAAKPFVRIGNQHVLPQDAAPPSMWALIMLAHMPLFRTEHHDDVEVIYRWISQPQPRQESVQLCGKSIVPQPQLVLGDPLPHRNAADADVPGAMHWLELMARLGFLKRNENWCKLFDRFLEDRNAHGVWHPHKGGEVAASESPYAWAMYPLEGEQAGEHRWSDLTLRLGLIARFAGRQIELE
jgi:hypothetical protein